MNGDLFLLRIDNEDRAWQFRHILDAAEEAFEFFLFTEKDCFFFLGEEFHGPVFFHLFEFEETFDAGFDGLVVGQHATEPSFVDVVFASADSFFFDGFLSLLLGTNEQDWLPFFNDFLHEIIRFIDELDGFRQVNDVDLISFCKNVRRHFRIPATCLMTKMYPCF